MGSVSYTFSLKKMWTTATKSFTWSRR